VEKIEDIKYLFDFSLSRFPSPEKGTEQKQCGFVAKVGRELMESNRNRKQHL